jgi:hypothetical protein
MDLLFDVILRQPPWFFLLEVIEVPGVGHVFHLIISLPVEKEVSCF